MKDKQKKTITLYFIISVIWCVSSVISFINKNHTFGALYLCLSAVYLILAINNKNK